MLLWIISFCFWALPSFGSVPKYVSLKSAFQSFIHDSKNSDFETQLKMWKSNVESAAPDVYSTLYQGTPAEIDQTRRQKAKKWLSEIIKHSDEILVQFDHFEKSEWPLIMRLTQLYPEVDFSDVRVMAMPSLMMFDGQVIDVGGHSVATFGMDFFAIASRNSKIIADADLIENPEVIVAHEFTHVLHQKLSNFAGAGSIEGLMDPLWKEGLAQVSSQMLNPGTQLSNIFMEKHLAERCAPAKIKIWAKKFQDDNKKTNKKNLFTNYGNWFFTSKSKYLGVPRAGYCLGYNAVLIALREHSLDELLKMKRADVLALLDTELSEMSR